MYPIKKHSTCMRCTKMQFSITKNHHTVFHKCLGNELNLKPIMKKASFVIANFIARSLDCF